MKRKHEYSPRERERATGPFAQPCNPERYHESLDTITPADRYLGRYRTPWTKERYVNKQPCNQGEAYIRPCQPVIKQMLYLECLP